MRYYNTIATILTSIISFYLLCALALHFYQGRNEVFPFFTWELYAKVPNSITDFTIRVKSLNGSKLEKPIYFQESKKYFRKANSVSAYFAFNKLGKAIRANKNKDVIYHRKYIEQIYLSGYKSLEYDVISRSYDPLKRIRKKNSEKYSIKLLASFKSGDY